MFCPRNSYVIRKIRENIYFFYITLLVATSITKKKQVYFYVAIKFSSNVIFKLNYFDLINLQLRAMYTLWKITVLFSRNVG